MATVECEGCGNDVDSKSIVCRNCGTPVGYESGEDVRAGPDTRPRFCTNCGSPVESDGDFCQTCGSAIGSNTCRRRAGLTDAGHLRHILSPERVVLMCILSSGFYLFYWFYLTWKHYRDHTGKEAFPVWHALTLLVPFYSYFRMHAHVRTYKELMQDARVATTLSTGWSVFALVIITILGNVSFRLSFGEITQGVANTLLVITFFSVGVTVALLVRIQGNLNRYWESVSNSTQAARFGVGEVVFSVLGVLTWLDALVSVVSESYRPGV